MTTFDPAALGLFAAACDPTITETHFRDTAACGLTHSSVTALTEVCDITPTEALAALIVRATRELRAVDPMLGEMVAQAAVASAAARTTGDTPLLLALVAQHETTASPGAA
ncbi:hypothetical protein [Ponticoccus litoralis]|uniref:DUF222 domain-containing protein n=1 Tax=Ponticoccus litoralis TaxID=422297 RepID=A0AAW9SQH6_9RHOB